MAGLRESMKRFGYLMPVIIDQHNQIVDGEHRATIYKEFGIGDIPCIRVELKDDVERRILRQSMNKLRGQHDINKDVEELEYIMNNDAQALKELLNIDQSTLNEMKALAAPTPMVDKVLHDHNPLDDKLATYLNTNIKQVVLYFNNEQYVKIVKDLEDLSQKLGTKDNTETVLALISIYYGVNDRSNDDT